MKSPKWLEQVLGSVCAACINEVNGRMSGLSYRWSKPEDNSWGTWLLMIAPAVVEIAGGKDDGATGFDFVDVDLLTLPPCLDEVESFAYDPDYGRATSDARRQEGQTRSRDRGLLRAFEDDEASTIFDVNFGGWRHKRTD